MNKQNEPAPTVTGDAQGNPVLDASYAHYDPRPEPVYHLNRKARRKRDRLTTTHAQRVERHRW
jgi:hypothetical protein